MPLHLLGRPRSCRHLFSQIEFSAIDAVDNGTGNFYQLYRRSRLLSYDKKKESKKGFLAMFEISILQSVRLSPPLCLLSLSIYQYRYLLLSTKWERVDDCRLAFLCSVKSVYSIVRQSQKMYQ